MQRLWKRTRRERRSNRGKKERSERNSLVRQEIVREAFPLAPPEVSLTFIALLICRGGNDIMMAAVK